MYHEDRKHIMATEPLDYQKFEIKTVAVVILL